MAKQQCEGCIAPSRCGVQERDSATAAMVEVPCYRTLSPLPDKRPVVVLAEKGKD